MLLPINATGRLNLFDLFSYNLQQLLAAGGHALGHRAKSGPR